MSISFIIKLTGMVLLSIEIFIILIGIVSVSAVIVIIWGALFTELVGFVVFWAYFNIKRSTTSATPSLLLEATITSASWRSSGVTLSTQTPSPAY